MTNSMKDLLLGLGFKPVPQQPVQERSRTPDPRPLRGNEGGERAPRPDRANAGPAKRPHPDAHRDRIDRGRRPSVVPNVPGAGQRVAQGRGQPQRTREEIDLAKAYAIRAQKEKEERIETERLKQEAARIKREAKARVAELVRDKALNRAESELTRHFDYNGKIRRVHVDEAQLKALNAGALGVVQLDGRYLLIDAALAREVHALLPSLLALLVDPDAPVSDDPYADPKYAIPDDLVW